MLEIAIMRHGKPDIPKLNKIKANAIQECIDLYNIAGLAADSRPKTTTLARFQQYATIVTSELKRSQDSAEILSNNHPIITDSEFRETELPILYLPALKLHPVTWHLMLRILWWLGLSGSVESYKAAKARAGNCAKKLIELAQQNGKVLFVGHGIINVCIAKQLKSLSWTGPSIPGKGYWEYGIYTKNVTK